MSKKEYDRLYRETPEGESIPVGVLGKNEEVIIQKKKKELTPKQKKLFKDKTELTKYSENLGGYVNMSYVRNELLFSKVDIDRANITRLIYLSTFIDYNTRQENLLVKHGKDYKIEPLTKSDIKKILGLGDTAFKSFLANVKKVNLIYEVDKKFYISPDYFTKGKVKFEGKDYARVFINTTRFLYENSNPKQHKQLSYIFQLVPYMNYELNILCYNPQERNFYELDKINLKQVCEILGVDTERRNMNKLKNELLKFKVNVNDTEYPFLSYAKIQNVNGSKDYFVINPQVVWQGKDTDRVKDTINLCFFD